MSPLVKPVGRNPQLGHSMASRRPAAPPRPPQRLELTVPRDHAAERIQGQVQKAQPPGAAR